METSLERSLDYVFREYHYTIDENSMEVLDVKSAMWIARATTTHLEHNISFHILVQGTVVATLDSVSLARLNTYLHRAITPLDIFTAHYHFTDLDKAQKTYAALSPQSKAYYTSEAAHLNAALTVTAPTKEKETHG